MIEKNIYLDGIDPIDFFGVNNKRFDRVKQHFPKLRIFSRGNMLTINGEEEEIRKFEERLGLFIDYLNRFNDISTETLDDILSDDGKNPVSVSSEETDVLLYGERGKPVRAITVNQKKLVE